MIYKTTLKDLILSFTLIMDRNNGKRDNRAIAISLEELKIHLISLNKFGFSFINKYEFLQLLDNFYQKSLNEKVKTTPKNKFYKKYFKYLIKKEILQTNVNFKNISDDDIFIISFQRSPSN